VSKSDSDWRKEAAERYKEKQSKGRFKLQEGENTLRILPRVGTKKPGAPFLEYRVHREVGPNKRFIRCGKTLHLDGDCWLCDKKIPELRDSGNKAKEQRAEALEAKEQFVVQVAKVDPDSGKMSGPFLWAVPTGGARSLAARLLGVLKSTKRDYVDPKKGYNLTIERTGTGMTDTQYGQPIPDDEPSKLPDKVLSAAKPFSALVAAYSESQQKAAYFGKDEAEIEEETSGKRGRDEEDEEEEETEEEEESEEPKKKKKHQDEDEEEEGSEEEETEEYEEDSDSSEEEEESPKKKKKKSSEDEEEPEEEEEEEEETEDEESGEEDEEEEQPKKKKKASGDEDEEEDSSESEEEEEAESEEDEEDEDEPKKKSKKHSKVEDEEEEPPKKKGKKARRSGNDDD